MFLCSDNLVHRISTVHQGRLKTESTDEVRHSHRECYSIMCLPEQELNKNWRRAFSLLLVNCVRMMTIQIRCGELQYCPCSTVLEGPRSGVDSPGAAWWKTACSPVESLMTSTYDLTIQTRMMWIMQLHSRRVYNRLKSLQWSEKTTGILKLG